MWIRNFSKFSNLSERNWYLKIMSTSKYFSAKRLTRSKVVTANEKIVIKTEPASRPEEPWQVTDSDTESISKKLAKKRIHIKIKSEAEESDSCKTDLTDEQTVDQKACIRPKWEPPLWWEQFQNIREMRKLGDAPVDTMGCDVISDEKAKPHVG